jgi:glucose/arabinose dehydrogenase
MKSKFKSGRWCALLAGSAFPASALAAVDFQVKLVASGLSQPNYVTQAPGETNPGILYYTERAASAVAGFSPVNEMGRIMRYDTSLSATPGYVGTPVIDLSATRNITNDDGMEGMAFSPDFNNIGTPGFGKIYISSSTYPGGGAVPTNRVEEYTTTNPANPTTANTTFSRTILQYNNNSNNNHTIDSIQFDPTATGESRNYLYISTGNGSFTNTYNGGVNGAVGVGMPSQNPADVKGKILRVDVNNTLPDAYPADSNKNFAIPTDNPVVTYNAAHPAALLQGANAAGPTPALGEVYVSGLRNSYRFSFDRSNGNMFLGDVGENKIEEVDVVPKSFNTGTGATVYNSHGPVDFGWPETEGTSTTNTIETGNDAAYPAGTANPFTGATAILPVQQYPHTVGSAVIGGYTYRGPVASLQGDYFYGDFVAGTVHELTGLSTDPSTFTGNNGTSTDVTSLLDSLAPGGTLGHVVSFGEDNQGDLFIVDFGGTAGSTSFTSATGEYPSAGLGQIFEIIPIPEPTSAAILIPATLMLMVRRSPRLRGVLLRSTTSPAPATSSPC